MLQNAPTDLRPPVSLRTVGLLIDNPDSQPVAKGEKPLTYELWPLVGGDHTWKATSPQLLHHEKVGGLVACLPLLCGRPCYHPTREPAHAQHITCIGMFHPRDHRHEKISMHTLAMKQFGTVVVGTESSVEHVEGSQA